MRWRKMGRKVIWTGESCFKHDSESISQFSEIDLASFHKIKLGQHSFAERNVKIHDLIIAEIHDIVWYN